MGGMSESLFSYVHKLGGGAEGALPASGQHKPDATPKDSLFEFLRQARIAEWRAFTLRARLLRDVTR